MILYQKRVELVTLDGPKFKGMLTKLTVAEMVELFAPNQAVADTWSALSQEEVIIKVFELGLDPLAQV